MQSPAELGHAIAADRILLVDPEHAVFIGIERHRLAMVLQISSRRRKIIEGVLSLSTNCRCISRLVASSI